MNKKYQKAKIKIYNKQNQVYWNLKKKQHQKIKKKNKINR